MMMRKLKLFNKYYGSNAVIGGRVSRKGLSYKIKDENELNEFLSSFFEECPAMPWFGENESSGGYYYLKSNWQILRHTYGFIQVTIARPLMFFKYLRCWIIDLKDIRKDYEYYMNPTINRKGDD